jgi:hypothetical protein
VRFTTSRAACRAIIIIMLPSLPCDVHQTTWLSLSQVIWGALVPDS